MGILQLLMFLLTISRPYATATKLSQLTIDVDLAMGAHNITLDPTQTVDGKDVSALAAGLSELGIDVDLAMGAHNITLGIGQTVDGKDVGTINGVASGTIRLWSGAIGAIPAGYVLCDGNNSTPNLTDRFVIHADADAAGTRNVGDVGGEQTHVLTVAELASHRHLLPSTTGAGGTDDVSEEFTAAEDGSTPTDYTGSGTAHQNMPKFYALAYIMKT